MWLELISLLVGAIISFSGISAFGAEFFNSVFAYIGASAFYISILILDFKLSRSYGVQPRKNFIGTKFWTWWGVAGVTSFIVQFLLNGVVNDQYIGIVSYISGLFISAILVITVLIILKLVNDHYYSRPKAIR